MYALKALRIYNVKEHHNLFSSNSTPLALIGKEGEIFQSKYTGDSLLIEKH